MKFQIDQTTVYFPYDGIYPEQYRYMVEVYKTITCDANGEKKNAAIALLEIPSCSGKVTCLLSLIMSYLYQQKRSNKNQASKLIYCTRSVSEMEKVLEECKFVYKYLMNSIREKMSDEDAARQADLLAIGVSSRKNLCINPEVKIVSEDLKVESKCRSITASWIREAALEGKSVNVCTYYEGYAKNENFKLPYGVYTLTDLNTYGRKQDFCPYFTARKAVQYADIIVYCYSHILDPKISSIVNKHLSKECIVVFDESQMIDVACTETFSTYVDIDILKRCDTGLNYLQTEISISRNEADKKRKLDEEYKRLLSSLKEPTEESDVLMAPPIRANDLPQEIIIPGNMRKPEHFWVFLKKLLLFLLKTLEKEEKTQQFLVEPAESFLENCYQKILMDSNTLKFCTHRLNSLFNTLEIADISQYKEVRLLADFATLMGTYGNNDNFYTSLEPYDERISNIFDPILQFICFDPSFAIEPVFKQFKSVIITSGILSPLSTYSKLLNITPLVARAYRFTYPRSTICPVVMARGSDQVAVSTQFRTALEPSVVRNYGTLLVEVARHIPDGVVAFFKSYQYMEEIVARWNSVDLLTTIRKYKLIVMETPNSLETSLALEAYRKACDSGRGAILFCVARSKIAETVDFYGSYGRAIIMYGIPFANSDTKLTRAKLEFLKRRSNIMPREYLIFDAMRYTANCIGKSLRSKNDFRVVILADKRYQQDKISYLPKWIQDQLTTDHTNLSTDTLMRVCCKFLKEAAQPIDVNEVTRLTEKDIESIQKRVKI
jgi:DNA excision repair protein ERCC-2